MPFVHSEQGFAFLHIPTFRHLLTLLLIVEGQWSHSWQLQQSPAERYFKKNVVSKDNCVLRRQKIENRVEM